jgi:hypothetical protein
LARVRRLPLYTFAVALAVSQLATRAAAQTEGLLGVWQQIESNAGKCPTCQVSFAQTAAALTVTANNGWAATVVVNRNGDLIAATGTGRWSSRSKPLADRPFSVEFVVRDARLYMTMLVVDAGSGPRRVIKAVFGRFWLGS